MVAALRELVELCRSGEFYTDHDASLDVLHRADTELAALERRPTYRPSRLNPTGRLTG